MNYYERIQQSIGYIEEHLEDEIKVSDVAMASFMSVANFHRLFFALAGYSVKEYIRCRRICLAAQEIKKGNQRILDVAQKFTYDSADSFARTFKNVTGYLPSQYPKTGITYLFERIDLMEKYFDKQEDKMEKEYPDVKVLKELEPMRVVCCNYFGKSPEDYAFEQMSAWIKKQGIDLSEDRYRIFGYNSPNPEEGSEEYGYEVCLTIPEAMEVDEREVTVKYLKGGLYAVIGVERGECLGENIMKGWKRFEKWLRGSKYMFGGHQWLEEHLGFDKEARHTGSVDLYMPIEERCHVNMVPEEEQVKPMLTVSVTMTGKNAEDRARKYLSAWAEKNSIDLSDGSHRIFAYYNFDRIGKPDFFYKLHISVDSKVEIHDKKLMMETFPGGEYLVRSAKYGYNGQAWAEFMEWMGHQDRYEYGDYWFFEEYLLKKFFIDEETKVRQYIPAHKKMEK